MKKRGLSLLLVVVLLFPYFPLKAQAVGNTAESEKNMEADYDFLAEIGEPDQGAVPIYSFMELREKLTADPDGSYVLTDDLDATEYYDLNALWEPLPEFRGTLDGQGHVIKNFTFTTPVTDGRGNYGLFAATSGAAIKNLGLLIDPDVPILHQNQYWDNGHATAVTSSVGGLIGRAYETNIINCFVIGDIQSNSASWTGVGGLIGFVPQGDFLIQNSYYSGNLSGHTREEGLDHFAQASCGGLIGAELGQEISILNCQVSGTITATSDDATPSRGYAGGFVGTTHGRHAYDDVNQIYIQNSICKADISGHYIGGLVVSCASLLISDSFYSGKLTATQAVGGLAYSCETADIEDCEYDPQIIFESDYTGSGATFEIGGMLGSCGSSATISSCVSGGSIVVDAPRGAIIGGLIGSAGSSVITDCQVFTDVQFYSSPASFNGEIGGFIGNFSGTDVSFTRSEYAGNMNLKNNRSNLFSYYGGFIGDAYEADGAAQSVLISDSTIFGQIDCEEADYYAGGIIGNCPSYMEITFTGENYYAPLTVNGSALERLCGQEQGSITNLENVICGYAVPTIIATTPQSGEVDVQADEKLQHTLTMTFDRPIAGLNGSLWIYEYETDRLISENQLAICAEYSDSHEIIVTVYGELAPETHYYVLVEDGIAFDSADNTVKTKSITQKYQWHFTTENRPVISLQEKSVEIAVSETRDIHMEISPVGGAVTWSSSDSTVASVDSNGVVTGVSAGSATITVQSTVDTRVKATCIVTCKELEIELSVATMLLGAGESRTLTAMSHPTDQISWESADPSVATVDENGTVTALRIGTTEIIATVVVAGNAGTLLTGTCKVTVPGVVFAETAIEAVPGVCMRPQYIVYPENTAIIWSSSNEDILEFETLTYDEFTTYLVGNATIYAMVRFKDEAGQWCTETSSCAVTVANAEPAAGTVQPIIYGGHVDLNYNKILWIFPDDDLPPIPEGNKAQYKEELLFWANELNYDISDIDLEAALDIPVQMPFFTENNEVVFDSYQDKNVQSVIGDIIMLGKLQEYLIKEEKEVLNNIGLEQLNTSTKKMIQYLERYKEYTNVQPYYKYEPESMLRALVACENLAAEVWEGSDWAEIKLLSKFKSTNIDVSGEMSTLVNEFNKLNDGNTGDYERLMARTVDALSIGTKLFKSQYGSIAKDLFSAYMETSDTSTSDNPFFKVVSFSYNVYTATTGIASFIKYIDMPFGAVTVAARMASAYLDIVKELWSFVIDQYPAWLFFVHYYVTPNYPDHYKQIGFDNEGRVELFTSVKNLDECDEMAAFLLGPGYLGENWKLFGAQDSIGDNERLSIINYALRLAVIRHTDFRYVQECLVRHVIRESAPESAVSLCVACPVDVSLVDADGNVVFTLKNGETYDQNYNQYCTFYLTGENREEKTLIFPDNLSAIITPYDTGNMDCAIQFLDASGAMVEQSYDALPVNPGTDYTVLQQQEAYILQCENNTLIPDKVEVVPDKISLNFSEVSLNPNEKIQVSIYSKNKVLDPKDFIWSIGSQDVVAVDANGLLTALIPGTSIIEVSSKSGTTSTRAVITVKENTLSGSPDTYGSDDSSVNEEYQYSVKVQNIEHGIVSLDTEKEKAGELVFLTVKPDEGYVLSALTVLDRWKKEIPLTKNSDGVYSFKMPAGDVTIQASFVKAVNALPFTDVSADYWAADEIAWALGNGYMLGNTSTTFNPFGTITRQQMWMILARLSGQNPADFTDACNWAVENGISDGSNPGQPVSRQQMVAMLYRYAVLMGYDTTANAALTSFPDYSVLASYAENPMAWSVANEIVVGTSDGKLNPEGAGTRAQFAVILYRFYKKFILQE